MRGKEEFFMQNNSESFQSPGDYARKKTDVSRYLARLRNPLYGYIGAFFLIILLYFIEKLDRFIPQLPLFLGAPFGLGAILAGLLWGLGPALLALVLGLFMLAKFVAPDAFTPDFIRDIRMLVPFLLLEILVFAVIMHMDKARRVLLTIHRELEIAHAKVLESNRELEQAGKLKDYVMTRAAHELRTPLTTILGRTQLLMMRLQKDGPIPQNCEFARKHLDVIEQRALHLRALIESLFELSSVRSEELPASLPPCDFKNLCYDLIEEQQTQSGRIIKADFPSGEIIVPADDKRISQAIMHILRNAVIYAEDDTIIEFHACVEKKYMILQVYNACSALDPEHVEKLFLPFYRTPSIEYSSVPGWGLGLTISKEIIERHKGQIWAEFVPAGGLNIFVKLPLFVSI